MAGKRIETKASVPTFEATFVGPNALRDAEAALGDAGLERDPKEEPARKWEGSRLLKRTWRFEPKDFSGIEVTATEQSMDGRIVIVVKSSKPFTTKAQAAVDSLRECEGACALRNHNEAKAVAEKLAADIRQGAADGKKAAAVFIARLENVKVARTKAARKVEPRTEPQAEPQTVIGAIAQYVETSQRLIIDLIAKNEPHRYVPATKAHPLQDKTFPTFAAGEKFLADEGFHLLRVITHSSTRATFYENEEGERRSLVQHVNLNGRADPETRLSVALHKSAPITTEEREKIFERKMAEGRAKLNKLKAVPLVDHTVFADAYEARTVLKAQGFEPTHAPKRARDGRHWQFFVAARPNAKNLDATEERILVIDTKGAAEIRISPTPIGLEAHRDAIDQALLEDRVAMREAQRKMIRPADWYDSLPPEIDGSAAREAHARYQDAVPTKPHIGEMAKIIANRSRHLAIETKEARNQDAINGFGAALARKYNWSEGKGVLLIQQAIEHDLTSGEMFRIADHEQARLLGHSHSSIPRAV